MRLTHISLTARDADLLAQFYQQVFGFIYRRPPTRLSGPKVARGNGLPGSDIYSIWLCLPDDDGPFLEIMEFAKPAERGLPAVNEPGYAHLAFEVADLEKTIGDVLRSGGSLQGEVTDFGTRHSPHLIIYMRDPEGNILELEQPFAGLKPGT